VRGRGPQRKSEGAARAAHIWDSKDDRYYWGWWRFGLKPIWAEKSREKFFWGWMTINHAKITTPEIRGPLPK
jgi:hypothetical protein